MAKVGSIAKDTFWNKLREKNGWSFKYIAKKTGIPQSTLGNWFSGVKAPRNEHHIHQLCELFEIPFDKGYNEFYHAEKTWDSTKKTLHYNNTFWNKLKEKNNLSNEEISEMTGIPKVTISSNFSGRYMPNSKSLEKYCKLFEIPLEQGKEEFKKAHKAFIAAQNGETPPEPVKELKEEIKSEPTKEVDFTFWPSVFVNSNFKIKDIATYLNVDEAKVEKYLTGELVPNFNQLRMLCRLYGGIDMTTGSYAFNLLHEHYLAEPKTLPFPEPHFDTSPDESAINVDDTLIAEVLKVFYNDVSFEEFMELQKLLNNRNESIFDKVYGVVSHKTYKALEAYISQ